MIQGFLGLWKLRWRHAAPGDPVDRPRFPARGIFFGIGRLAPVWWIRVPAML
jgi:hypothetical protein